VLWTCGPPRPCFRSSTSRFNAWPTSVRAAAAFRSSHDRAAAFRSSHDRTTVESAVDGGDVGESFVFDAAAASLADAMMR
jgi:hypothetical protein